MFDLGRVAAPTQYAARPSWHEWLSDPRTLDKPMRSSVIAFSDYLSNIDSASIVSEGNPLRKTLVEYCMDQGQTAYHPCELL